MAEVFHMAAREKFPSEQLDQYMVRFPEGMRDLIKEAAAANGRSMNSEIIARLESTFPVVFDLDDHENDRVYFLAQQLKGIHDRLGQLTQDAEYIQQRLVEELKRKP